MAALDFPNSPTLNQQYAAPNGVTYQWDGTAWIVTGGPPGQLWTASGSTLMPTDVTKTVSVPGGAAGAGVAAALFGSNTAKARIQSPNTSTPARLWLTTNRDGNAVGTAGQDDATKPSWQLSVDSAADNCSIQRQPAGGSPTSLLGLDNAGNLSLAGRLQGIVSTRQAVAGPVSFTTSGAAGTWKQVCVTPALTIPAGAVVWVFCTVAVGYAPANASANTVYLRLARDGTGGGTGTELQKNRWDMSGIASGLVALPTFFSYDISPPAGSHTYDLEAFVANANGNVVTQADSGGVLSGWVVY